MQRQAMISKGLQIHLAKNSTTGKPKNGASEH